MKSSSIRHPQNTRYIQIHDWQIQFCQGNHCAALLLAFFAGWHEWKIKHDEYYQKFNDIAEMHGDGRPHNEEAYLFFSTEQLIEGTLGFYGKKAINEALDFLVSLNVISIHKNPNKRYHFDKTKYFKFYPNVCNHWIDKNCSNHTDRNYDDIQVLDSKERAKVADASGENGRPTGESDQPSGEKARYITNTTNNTTNKNKSTQSNGEKNDFTLPKPNAEKETPQQIIDALITEGISTKKIHHPNILPEITKLQAEGATLDTFIEAYSISVNMTGDNGFGMNYLFKVVNSLLQKRKHCSPLPQTKHTTEPIYKSDFRNAMSWAADIIGDWKEE